MSAAASPSEDFRSTDAERLARERYGLTARARPLPAERDRNFLLCTENGSFVLKIAWGAERAEALDLQNAALEWLHRRTSLPVPRVCPTVSGALVESLETPGGRRFVRLLTYLPGATLAESRPRTPAVRRALGAFLGELDRALEGFSHPAAVDRRLVWDPASAIEVIASHLSAVRDGGRRALVEHFVSEHARTVTPLLRRLPRSVIHNDANDHNVLLGEPTRDGRPLAGLVDFGDMLETWTVCELAVAMAYAVFDTPDPLSAASDLVAGYHRERPLAEPELEALWTLCAVRLCTSVCLSAHRTTAQAENAYLRVSEASAWDALERLRAVHP